MHTCTTYRKKFSTFSTYKIWYAGVDSDHTCEKMTNRVCCMSNEYRQTPYGILYMLIARRQRTVRYHQQLCHIDTNYSH